MANNKLKYWRVDSALREQLRRDWNHPVLWPLGLGAAILSLFGVWMVRVLKRREQAK
jgi:oligopeptide transport system substrate-binding protein